MGVAIREELKTLLGLVALLMLMMVSCSGAIYGTRLYHTDHRPEQPIAFSHKVHAGENQIPCQYCHIYARRSTVAGVPSVNKCINCHKYLSKQSDELDKLFKYWQRQESIPWVKVHDVPDFVYFSHKRHVSAGLDCRQCHGDVAAMTVVEKVSSLQMGWCRQCHRKNHVQSGQDCLTCHK